MPIDVQRLDSFSIGDDPKSVGTRWKKWIGSFQIYLEALGKINEKQQKALLLHTAGLEVQEVFNTLNLTGDSLQDAIEGLTNYFAPQANKYFERYQFIEASQESGKTHNNSSSQVNHVAYKSCYQHAKKGQTNGTSKPSPGISKYNKGKPNAYSQKSQSHIGTQKPQKKSCFRCGKQDHYSNDWDKCPASGQTCNNCRKRGHLTSQCKFAKQKTTKQINRTVDSNDGFSSNEESVHKTTEVEQFAFHINSVNKDAQERLMAQIEINGKLTPMQIDTAADVTIISERIAQTVPNLVIRPSDKVLKIYNGTNIEVVGSSQVKVQYKDQEIGKLPLTIVKGQGQTLLGLDWLRCIKLDWPSVLRVTDTKQEPAEEISLTNLLSDYKEVFEDRVGTVKNAQAVLVLKENATPRFSAPRPVPYALKTAVETEIRRLESEGSWEKVDYSDWSTPLVPIVKDNGQVRLCGDYKVTLNPQLQVAQHPLPNPKDMFATLSGCSVFSKIDLRQAFQQLSMDENSQKLCMSGVFIFIDDILVTGKNKKEHRERLRAVLKKLKEHNIKVNQSKCILEVDSVEYLGFIVNGKGIHKTQDKVNAVQSAKLPENVKELQSFLGLVTFYGSFIQNLATIAHPLYNLLNKDVKWNWTKECQNAFERIKAEVTSPTFLVHYQMDLPVKLVCDASNIGLGAVLAHVMPDGTEKPIAFASRVLNKAERNYSQIEKEALALVYGVKKFHMYLYGRKRFTLVTDHKPLLMILGPKASLPTLVAARLQRRAIILAAYDYNIEYRPTSKMGNADALSRLPVDKAPEQYEESILLISAYNSPITAKEIAQGTKKDPVLSKVVQSLITGRDICAEDANCKPYKEIWNELSVTQECILRGSRVVIPNALRNRVLSEIHADHQGIVRSKSIARTYVWWTGVDRDIENLVKKCMNCALQQNNPIPTRMHPWELPRYPWQRVHIDFAGPFLGYSYLILVDAYSKWPEVIPMQTTSSVATIRSLMQIFSTHGLPERIVTDNGPQFTSQEFMDFLNHPSTNGEAERFVQTFKHNMKCRQANSGNVASHIAKFLLSYRTTVHNTTGITPSYLLMGRRIRNKLDLMYPSLQSQLEQKGYDQVKKLPNVRHFAPSGYVMVRSYNTPEKWVQGEIVRKIGNLHYDVNVGGKIVKRHVDQLQSFGTNHTEVKVSNTSDLNNSDVQTAHQDVQNHATAQNTPTVLPNRMSRGKPPERLDL
ncbi:uncharacterized protein K02A2.6-like [Macrobrachium nipponense]|uniref:uncharacterized protein K02A2.6-like n=1 Tax=Macrobrachium nipponense TaxID=159736 RepID=UPI0030C7E7BB